MLMPEAVTGWRWAKEMLEATAGRTGPLGKEEASRLRDVHGYLDGARHDAEYTLGALDDVSGAIEAIFLATTIEGARPHLKRIAEVLGECDHAAEREEGST
jgi:hypothetical protein